MADTPQQKVALRTNPAAQRVRKAFPVGTRVVGRDAAEPRPVGTVKRHVPGTNAQGGYLVVEWPNGEAGRHGAISLERVAP